MTRGPIQFISHFRLPNCGAPVVMDDEDEVEVLGIDWYAYFTDSDSTGV